MDPYTTEPHRRSGRLPSRRRHDDLKPWRRGRWSLQCNNSSAVSLQPGPPFAGLLALLGLLRLRERSKQILQKSLRRVREERSARSESRSKLSSDSELADGLVHILCQAETERNFEDSLTTILLPEVQRSKALLGPVLRALCQQKGAAKLVYATLEKIREDGSIELIVSNYTVGISTCARAKLWQQAVKLFESMPTAKLHPNVISHSATISACEKGRQWQQALELFEAMPKAKVQPNAISYNAAISACEKGGQWQQALELFEAMPKAKVQPTVISYSAAISACEKGGQWQQALSLFEAIPKANVQPNVISYSAAISACDKGGQWQQALKIFKGMPKTKVQPNVITYNAAVSACEKGGQWRQALKLLETMPKGPLADLCLRSATYHSSRT